LSHSAKKIDAMKLIITLIVACLSFASLGAQAQQNPFSGRSAAPQEKPALDDEAAAKPLIVLPAPMRAVFRQIADWQRELNRFLGGKLRESSDTGGGLAALTVLLASFAYGVLHAAGPGHGKMVVASYFTAKQAPLKTGILMGGVIALTQAVVAVAVVGLLAVVIGRSQREVMSDANWLELASYGVIFAIGAYMTYCALTGREAFAHDHGPPASTFDDGAKVHDHHHAHHHGHDHGGHHHHEHHDHHHGHDHGGNSARETWLAKVGKSLAGRDGEVVAVGIVSGVRPCTGSILVLLFSLANGVFLLGIAAALFIAFGVAITVSVLGIATIMLRRSVAGGEHNAAPWRVMANRALNIAGSFGVMLMGGLLFGGALELNGLI
jgi:ABC-type nickel/cobalt efflux system permease component RcnA